MSMHMDPSHFVSQSLALTTSVRKSLVVSLGSYQWLWSSHCLSNSIGGWAPYFSLAGMFRSSTKTTDFFPMGGPYTPFLLLINEKTLFYVSEFVIITYLCILFLYKRNFINISITFFSIWLQTRKMLIY